jgi:hypothetical protein
MTTRKIFGCLITALMFINMPFVVAAKSSDLKRCQKMAIYELRQCLAQNPSDANSHCWVKSQLVYDSCAQSANNNNDNPNQQNARHKPSKQQIKAARKLDKKLQVNKVRIRLMAAANLPVYRQIIDEVLDGLNERQSTADLTKKQSRALQDRALAYQRFLGLVENQVVCDQMKAQIVSAYAPNKSNVRDSALPKEAREVIKQITSYCRVTD